MTTLMTPTIPGTVDVFNADYRFHYTAPWPRALRLLLRGKARVIEAHSPAVHIRSASDTIELPVSVVLDEYHYVPYRRLTEKVSRRGVLVRDKHTCAYCRGRATTIDHVLPKAQGGRDEWENLVAACASCNGFKADRTPQQAGMKLLWQPYAPKDKDRFAAV